MFESDFSEKKSPETEKIAKYSRFHATVQQLEQQVPKWRPMCSRSRRLRKRIYRPIISLWIAVDRFFKEPSAAQDKDPMYAFVSYFVRYYCSGSRFVVSAPSISQPFGAYFAVW